MKEGRELRDKALAFLEQKRGEWISKARLEAIFIARHKGTVTINDVRDAINLPEDFHPNTWGRFSNPRILRRSASRRHLIHRPMPG